MTGSALRGDGRCILIPKREGVRGRVGAGFSRSGGRRIYFRVPLGPFLATCGLFWGHLGSLLGSVGTLVTILGCFFHVKLLF